MCNKEQQFLQLGCPRPLMVAKFYSKTQPLQFFQFIDPFCARLASKIAKKLF
jgi:hypothetical protein